MEQTQNEFLNEVHLTGQVKHINRNLDKQVTSVEIATYERHTNYPTVLCFGEMLAKADEIKEGDWVNAVGRIETRRKKVSEQDPTKIDYRQGIVLTDIKKVESVGEKYFGTNAEKNGIYDSENMVVLSGTINSFKVSGDKNNRAQATVYCMNGKFRNLIMLTFYSNDAEALVNQYEKGDWVNVIARVQTIPSTKTSTGKKKEVLVGRRISKANIEDLSAKEDMDEREKVD